MEREKIKLSLFYLMLCLIILLCLSNKVIAKENTPNSYNIPTDCYLKVTPRKKKTVLTQSSTPQITVKKTTKVTTKKERMKKTAKKNFSKTTTKTRKRKKVSKNVTVSTVVETVTVTTTKILKKKGSKIRTVVRKTVTTVKTTKTTIATSNNSININSLDRGFMISKFSDIKGHVNPKVYNAFDELGFTFKIDSQLKTTGVFSIQNHWIKLKNGRSAYLLHELGHFVSCLKGKNGSKIDTSSEFVRIYNTEKNNYVGYNKGYVTRTSSEFFAEAFRDYTDNPIILKKCCSQTYAYMEKMVNSISANDIVNFRNRYGWCWTKN